MPDVELSKLLNQQADRGRTIWTWRPPREEGPVPEAIDVKRHRVCQVVLCGMTGCVIMDDCYGDADDFVKAYMTKAYPRSGRLKTRRN